MNNHVATVRAVFDDWARRGRAEGMERGHGPVARQAFERLNVGAGDRYLDVGCGNGYTVRWAAAVEPSVEALGVDVSTEMIALARHQTEAANARFLSGAFPHAEVAAGSVDALFSMEVFYYLPDLHPPLAAGTAPTWKHQVGSLLTFGRA